MEHINFTYIEKELIPANRLGEGHDAICYKNDKNRVYKIFKNKKIINEMTVKTILNGDRELFSSLSNDSVHTPDLLVFDDSKRIVGYSYPYVSGTVISQMSEDITVSQLFENYDKLLGDIDKISEKGFYIKGIHRDNILFDENNTFHIIDLDNGCFWSPEQKRILYPSNCQHISRTIIKNIFGKGSTENLEFKDESLTQLCGSVYSGDTKTIKGFIDYVGEKYCDEEDPKIITLRKRVELKTKIRNPFF